MKKKHLLDWYILGRLRSRKAVRRAGLVSDSDSSSIADVAFLLLIFFIVTSSFLLPQGLFLKLPSESSKPTRVKQKYIIDLYPRKETYLINKKKYDDTALKELFQNKLKETPQTVLVVHMRREVPYSRFVDTLNIAREAKLRRISLKQAGN